MHRFSASRSASLASGERVNPYALGDRCAPDRAPWQAHTSRSNSAEYERRRVPPWPAPPPRYADAHAAPSLTHEHMAHLPADARSRAECEWGADLRRSGRPVDCDDRSRSFHPAGVAEVAQGSAWGVRSDEAARLHYLHARTSPAPSYNRYTEDYAHLSGDHGRRTWPASLAQQQPHHCLSNDSNVLGGSTWTRSDASAQAGGSEWERSHATGAHDFAHRVNESAGRESARPNPMRAADPRPCKFGTRCMSAHASRRELPLICACFVVERN